MSPYLFLEQLISSGNQILLSTHNDSISKASLLIKLESVIDNARSYVELGASSSYPEEKQAMEIHLNELRSKINELIDMIDKSILKTKLKEAHRMTENSWGLADY